MNQQPIKKRKIQHKFNAHHCASRLISRLGKITVEQIVTDKQIAFQKLAELSFKQGWTPGNDFSKLTKIEKNFIRTIALRCSEQLSISTIPLGSISGKIIFDSGTGTSELEENFISLALEKKEPTFGYLSLNTQTYSELKKIYCQSNEITNLPPHLQLIPKFSSPYNLLSFSQDTPYKLIQQQTDTPTKLTFSRLGSFTILICCSGDGWIWYWNSETTLEMINSPLCIYGSSNKERISEGSICILPPNHGFMIQAATTNAVVYKHEFVKFDHIQEILKLQGTVKHQQLYSITWNVVGNLLEHVKESPSEFQLLEQLCRAFYNHCKKNHNSFSWCEPDASKIWSESRLFLRNHGCQIEDFVSSFLSDWMKTVSHIVHTHAHEDPTLQLLIVKVSEMTFEFVDSHELSECVIVDSVASPCELDTFLDSFDRKEIAAYQPDLNSITKMKSKDLIFHVTRNNSPVFISEIDITDLSWNKLPSFLSEVTLLPNKNPRAWLVLGNKFSFSNCSISSDGTAQWLNVLSGKVLLCCLLPSEENKMKYLQLLENSSWKHCLELLVEPEANCLFYAVRATQGIIIPPSWIVILVFCETSIVHKQIWYSKYHLDDMIAVREIEPKKLHCDLPDRKFKKLIWNHLELVSKSKRETFGSKRSKALLEAVKFCCQENFSAVVDKNIKNIICAKIVSRINEQTFLSDSLEDEASSLALLSHDKNTKAPVEFPPSEFKNRPCWRPAYGEKWQALPWEHKIQLQEGEAWFIALNNVLNQQQINALSQEDREINWRQYYVTLYGATTSLKHFNFFAADSTVQGYMADYGKPHAGKLGLFVSQGLQTCPVRCNLLYNLCQEKLGNQPHSLNSVQSLLYVGSVVGENTVKATENSQDHCNMHNGDGDACWYDSAMITICRGAPAFFFISRNKGKLVDTGELYCIPTSNNTGYVLGGKNIHTHYAHGKYMAQILSKTQYHVSDVYRALKPATLNQGQIDFKRWTNLDLNWNDLPSSKPWYQLYLWGDISINRIHPKLLELNKSTIVFQQHKDRFTPGDEFTSMGALQVFHLHPSPKGSGIAGRNTATSIFIGNTSKYSNKFTHDGSRLILQYCTPTNWLLDDGENLIVGGSAKLLEASRKQQTLVRVFIGGSSPIRSIFRTISATSTLYVMNAKVLKIEKNDNYIGFVLEGDIPSRLQNKD